MSSLNLNNVQDELINFARSLVKDPRSRHTTTSETFDGDGLITAFKLSNKGTCINSVTVNSVAKEWGADYTYDGNNRTVNFITVPGAGTGNIVINYDYGFSWGYWGYPNTKIKPSDYPLFALTWIGSESVVADLGANYLESSPVVRLWVYANDENDLKSSETVKSLLSQFRDELFSKTDWHIDGKGQRRIVPISIPDEPRLDARRSGRAFGGFVDIELPLINELKS
jgi:hypothetical protein